MRKGNEHGRIGSGGFKYSIFYWLTLSLSSLSLFFLLLSHFSSSTLPFSLFPSHSSSLNICSFFNQPLPLSLSFILLIYFFLQLYLLLFTFLYLFLYFLFLSLFIFFYLFLSTLSLLSTYFLHSTHSLHWTYSIHSTYSLLSTSCSLSEFLRLLSLLPPFYHSLSVCPLFSLSLAHPLWGLCLARTSSSLVTMGLAKDQVIFRPVCDTRCVCALCALYTMRNIYSICEGIFSLFSVCSTFTFGFH